MKPRIVVFCCTNAVVMPEDEVEAVNASHQAAVQITRLPCSGRSDVLHILRAMEDGADAALVVGCPDGVCQFLEGNLRARMRVRYANRLLAEAGLGTERVHMVTLAPDNPQGFADALRKAIARACAGSEEQDLGPASPDGGAGCTLQASGCKLQAARC
jgi:F420-non-reducing hydrogenase iron-sulfur subunit